MNCTIAQLFCIAILVACGVYLLLERALTRILLGILLLSNALNIYMLILAGKRGNPPFYGSFPIHSIADPLAQALCLTSIVISMGTGAFILALAYRSFMTSATDEFPEESDNQTAIIDAAHPGAAAKLVESEDKHSYISDPRIDRVFSDEMDDPTGDLFEPLSLDETDDPADNGLTVETNDLNTFDESTGSPRDFEYSSGSESTNPHHINHQEPQ